MEEEKKEEEFKDFEIDLEEEKQAKINQQIEDLKNNLRDTDYVIIKQMESTLLGESLPYTIKELKEITKQRKAQRDEINELEKKKKNGNK